jgi:hypothetical protein
LDRSYYQTIFIYELSKQYLPGSRQDSNCYRTLDHQFDPLQASSHREAPLIANDPLADNTDLYAFRSPDNPNMITIIANYIPAELPMVVLIIYTFGENIRYEIHIDNDASKPGDEIVFRFVFKRINEDPTTFFNIRLGKQNIKTTYTMSRSIDGGKTFVDVVTNGLVPPPYIGARSITTGVGLNTTYDALISAAIMTSSTVKKVFWRSCDDPFYVDLGGIFDLGNSPRQDKQNRDGIAKYNVHSIAIQIPITTLLKSGVNSTPASILDPKFRHWCMGIIQQKSLPHFRYPWRCTHLPGDWIQVSRLGMPLTNEAVIPLADKDLWNSMTPYDDYKDTKMDEYFFNPELALYMDDAQFGGAVPSFSPSSHSAKQSSIF